MSDDDTIDRELAELDPAHADPPPIRGSNRYESILERAMTTSPTLPDASNESSPVPSRPTAFAPRRHLDGRRRRPTRSRRLALAGAAVAASLSVVVAVVAMGSDDRPSAAATVETAAIHTGDVTRLRGRLTATTGDEPASTSTAEVDGSDYRIETDGDDGPAVFTLVGDTVWETVAGETTSQPYDPINARPTAFGASSEAVVRAALEGSEVEDLGSEQVRGVEAAHYRVQMTAATRAALADLSPSVLGWFELEYPEYVSTVEVWVADELIHRIEVVSTQVSEVDGQRAEIVSTTTTDFYDFGADITIEPPE